MAKIAIITRTKNRPIMLKRAIESVASQTYCDYIHVIVNDGGDANEVESLINSMGNTKRTLIIHNSQSTGMEAASNIGIRACDSEYILIHDDDDSLEPIFLEKMLEFLDTNCYMAACSHVTLVKETLNGDIINIQSKRLYRDEKAISIGQMAVTNLIVPIAFLYNRNLHNEVGFYDESLPVLGDWDFYMRVIKEHDIGVLPIRLANYHQRLSSEGNYANSLTAAMDKHAIYAAIVKNKIFRLEMESGKLGIGFLSQMVHAIQELPSISEDYYVKGVIFQILSNRPKKVAIYGTGKIGTRLYYEMKKIGLAVSCFIENDDCKSMDTHMGLPILSLEAAMESGERDVAIGSWEYNYVIIERIHQRLEVEKYDLRIYSV